MPVVTGQPVSSKVVESVAALEEVDPVDLDERLNNVVDPDALDALFSGRGDESGSDRRASVTFSYCGYMVIVRGSGEVTIEATDGGSQSSESSRRTGSTVD